MTYGSFFFIKTWNRCRRRWETRHLFLLALYGVDLYLPQCWQGLTQHIFDKWSHFLWWTKLLPNVWSQLFSHAKVTILVLSSYLIVKATIVHSTWYNKLLLKINNNIDLIWVNEWTNAVFFNFFNFFIFTLHFITSTTCQRQWTL